MNNNSYHEAGKKVLNWSKISIQMKAHYGAWKTASDVTWVPKFYVNVTHHNGRKLKENYIYPFEDREWADTCMRWWRENGCLAELREANP